jgi:hypothetical protein
MRNRFEKVEAPEYVEGKSYTNIELDAMAEEILRKDSKNELCRECGEKGAETGESTTLGQYTNEGDLIIDDDGNQLFMEFPELKCTNDHTWFKGEGRARGLDGDSPILFEEHLQSRRRREIYPVEGTPDPSIVSGSYNRTHPEGRKVNSKSQRQRHGASYFR